MPNHEPLQMHKTLRNLREFHGHTQKEIAILLGVSFQQVQKYEAGKNRLPVEKLFILKHFYDLPYEEFFMSGAPFPPRFSNDKAIDHICTRLKKIPISENRSRICKIIEILLDQKDVTQNLS